MKNLFLSFIVLALMGSLLLLPNAKAAEVPDVAESITLSPVNRKYMLDAGQTLNDKLTVVNDGQVDYDFIVYSRPYSIPKTQTGEFDYSKPNFIRTPQNADAYGWIQFPKTRYTLKAGATQEIAYSVTVPPQAAPGGHYGVIFAETQPAQKQGDGNSVVRKKRVGTIIYATVNGEYINKGQPESVDMPFWQLQPPLIITATAKNSGNTDFTDDTTYTIKDVFGRTKYQEKKQYTILPQTSRKMIFEWKGASWLGFYKVELEQTILDKKTNNSSYVLILPRFIPIALLVLILVGGAYAWFRHRQK